MPQRRRCSHWVILKRASTCPDLLLLVISVESSIQRGIRIENKLREIARFSSDVMKDLQRLDSMEANGTHPVLARTDMLIELGRKWSDMLDAGAPHVTVKTADKKDS
jgi:hypothetical protein